MWFRVDDGFHSSRKLHKVPRRQRFAAAGLWAIAGSWAADNLTDGHIPNDMIASWGPPKSTVDALVDAGLWDRVHDGFDFRNWDEYQASRADIESDRAANRRRKQESRSRLRQQKLREHAEHAGVSHVTGHNVTGGVTTPIPSHPIPIDKDSSSEPSVRPEVEELCSLLADLIEANGSKRPTITKAWRDEARRMLDIDGRDPVKAGNLIRWVQADAFWRSNILSMPKFRKQYDALRLRAADEWAKGNKGVASPEGEIDVDAILGRDVDGIGTPPEEIWGDEAAEQEWRTKRRAERKAERLAEARQVLARRQGAMV